VERSWILMRKVSTRRKE